MSFRYPPYDIANLVKLRAPTKVPFKKGETMADQKIGGGGIWKKTLLGTAIAVGIAAVFAAGNFISD